MKSNWNDHDLESDHSDHNFNIRDNLKACSQYCGLRRALPVLLLVAYSFIGAVVFMHFEREPDQNRRDAYLNIVNLGRKQLEKKLSETRKIIKSKSSNSSVGDDGWNDHSNLVEVYLSMSSYMSTLVYLLASWIHEHDPHSWNRSLPNEILPKQIQVVFSRVLRELEFGYVNKTEEWKIEQTTNALKWFEDEVKLTGWVEKDLTKSPWTLWGALLYSGTLYTTIGWGQFAPTTTVGRAATVVYALLGIPLFLTIINLLGKCVSKTLRYMWSGCLKGLKRLKRLLCSQRRGRKLSFAIKAASFDVDDMEDEYYSFPVSIALFLLFSWIFISAAIFLLKEPSWSYWTAVYFFFTSVTTIGLGDVIPEYNPRFMVLLFLLILIGLTLVSMCFNVIQLKIEALLDQMLLDMEEGYLKTLLAEAGSIDISPHESPEMGRRPMKKLSDVVLNLVARNKKFNKNLVKTVRRGSAAIFHPTLGAIQSRQYSFSKNPLQERMKKRLLYNMMDDSKLKRFQKRVLAQGSKRHVGIQANVGYSRASKRWHKLSCMANSHPDKRISEKSEISDTRSMTGPPNIDEAISTHSDMTLWSYHTAVGDQQDPMVHLDPVLLFCEEPTAHIASIPELLTPKPPPRRRVANGEIPSGEKEQQPYMISNGHLGLKRKRPPGVLRQEEDTSGLYISSPDFPEGVVLWTLPSSQSKNNELSPIQKEPEDSPLFLKSSSYSV